MKRPLRVRLIICRPLMKPHRIRKAHLKQIVVTRSHPFQNIRQPSCSRRRKIRKAPNLLPWQNQSLKRPYRPIRNHRHKLIICTNLALPTQLLRQIIPQHRSSMLKEVLLLRHAFRRRLIRNMPRSPHLAVRVRIARPHHCPAILKHLHIVDPLQRPKLRRLRPPAFNHPLNRRQRHLR